MTKKSFIVISSVVGFFLAIPLIGMQFYSEIQWTSFDFLVAAVMLFGAGFIADIILRKIKTRKSRIFFLIAFAAFFLLVWAELAVGIFGTPLAGS